MLAERVLIELLRFARGVLSISPEPSFHSETALHRLGQNSAAAYGAHCSKNFCRMEKDGTNFWMMRSQSTDKEQPEQATMKDFTARALVDMLFMSETEAKEALRQAGVHDCNDESGKARMRMTALESQSQCAAW